MNNPLIPSDKKALRGFATMDPQRQREIASQGGKAAHAKGVAHQFAPGAEAREAGRKSAIAQGRGKKK